LKVRIALGDASAASQAVGPPGSDFEMSCGGRSFANVAQRMLTVPMLNRQVIDPTDSVLDLYAGRAIKPNYQQLIQAAFQPRLWNSAQPVSLAGLPYTQMQMQMQMQANFSLFFGLVIQMYEATLLSDQAPLDTYLQGNTAALGASEVRGMGIFLGKGQCINCQNGPELSAAATVLRLQPYERVERMLMGAGARSPSATTASTTSGFARLQKTWAWAGSTRGATRYRSRVNTALVLQGGSVPDSLDIDPCLFFIKISLAKPCDPLVTPTPDVRDAVDGAFKVPTLRNPELTDTHFHNGSRSTLEQVVEFHNRGGDRRGPDGNDTTGFGMNPKGMTPAEVTDLVAFLRNGGDRSTRGLGTRTVRSPVDHPSINVMSGHVGNEVAVVGTVPPNPLMAKVH